MKIPTDRQPPRRPYADANGGRTPETFREYWLPERGERKVTRHELMVILARIEHERPHRRFARWLKSWVTPERAELPGGPHP